VGLLLAVSFGTAAWEAHQGEQAATRQLCEARPPILGRDVAGGLALRCGSDAAAPDAIRYLRDVDVQLMRNLRERRDQLAVATRGVVIALLVTLLGYSALTRPPESRADANPPPWGLRAWAFAERAGFTAAGLVAALGVVALLHLVGSGEPPTTDLLAHAVRIAVDAPFRAVLVAAGAPDL
jgi:hypothetical protein